MLTFRILTHCFISMLLLPAFSVLSAQQRKIDSLYKVLASTKEDTSAIRILLHISRTHYDANNPDSALPYAVQANKMAASIHSPKILARSYDALAYAYELKGNHPEVLDASLNMLKIYEELNDKPGIAWSYAGIAVAYGNLDDLEQGIFYQKKAYQLFKEMGDTLNEATAANVIGDAYLNLNNIDSGLVYFQKGYEISSRIHLDHSAQHAFALYGLGRTNHKLGNASISIPYYQKSIEEAERIKSIWSASVLEASYSGLADIFRERDNTDSALAYYHKALDVTISKSENTADVYRNLASLYDGKDNGKTITYLKLEAALRDSLYDSKDHKRVQLITYKEQERQAKLMALQAKEHETRKKNIQYAAIAIGVVGAVLLFFLLSRSIIVGTKAIKLGGIVILLIGFEFINLLIHPFLERITHHSPFLMLLIMVCIAALIVPLHHKVEKVMIAKLQEKNRKIRLEAAKKTIAELGNDNSTIHIQESKDAPQ